MKVSWKQLSVVLELVIVLLVTVRVFQVGVAVARAERGYEAYGVEYLLLALPVFYYAGKQILQDWLAEFQEILKNDTPQRKKD